MPIPIYAVVKAEVVTWQLNAALHNCSNLKTTDRNFPISGHIHRISESHKKKIRSYD